MLQTASFAKIRVWCDQETSSETKALCDDFWRIVLSRRGLARAQQCTNRMRTSTFVQNVGALQNKTFQTQNIFENKGSDTNKLVQPRAKTTPAGLRPTPQRSRTHPMGSPRPNDPLKISRKALQSPMGRQQVRSKIVCSKTARRKRGRTSPAQKYSEFARRRCGRKPAAPEMLDAEHLRLQSLACGRPTGSSQAIQKLLFRK